MSEPGNYKSLQAAVGPKQSVYSESTVAEAVLGTSIQVGDRVYKYAVAGAGLAAGDLVGNIISDDVVNATAGAAAVIGTREVTVYGAAAIAAGFFNEGTLITADATGQGYVYRIKSQSVCSSAGNCTVVLYDPLQVALGVASELTLIENQYKVSNVITATSPIQGVAPCVVTSGNYCWIQQEGIAAVKVTGTVAFGSKLIPATTGGAAVIAASANSNVIGLAMAGGTTGDNAPVLLTLSNK